MLGLGLLSTGVGGIWGLPPVPPCRFIGLKMKSVTFEDSLFEECYFEDITSSNTFFKNCTFISTVFYNTGGGMGSPDTCRGHPPGWPQGF